MLFLKYDPKHAVANIGFISWKTMLNFVKNTCEAAKLRKCVSSLTMSSLGS